MSSIDATAGLVRAAFRPLIPANVRLRELSIVPLIVGVLLGVIFGASSLYLVLKVGLTVSASIPVAVMLAHRSSGPWSGGPALGDRARTQHRPDRRLCG